MRDTRPHAPHAISEEKMHSRQRLRRVHGDMGSVNKSSPRAETRATAMRCAARDCDAGKDAENDECAEPSLSTCCLFAPHVAASLCMRVRFKMWMNMIGSKYMHTNKRIHVSSCPCAGARIYVSDGWHCAHFLCCDTRGSSNKFKFTFLHI